MQKHVLYEKLLKRYNTLAYNASVNQKLLKVINQLKQNMKLNQLTTKTKKLPDEAQAALIEAQKFTTRKNCPSNMGLHLSVFGILTYCISLKTKQVFLCRRTLLMVKQLQNHTPNSWINNLLDKEGQSRMYGDGKLLRCMKLRIHRFTGPRQLHTHSL